MIILGIESTAHTFSAGIVKDGKILSDERAVYTPESGGIDPGKAREHHEKRRDSVLERALEKVGANKNDIDLVAYSAGPGLPPSLVVGLESARAVARSASAPLMEVNHPVAHLEIARHLTSAADPVFLYVSGGNTQIIGYAGGRYRVFGETLDTAIGNAIDTFMREAGHGFPGGPEMERLATGKYVELPYVVKGMDLSFSGILSAAVQKLGDHKLEDLCFSFQETCYAMLTEVTERALAHTGKSEVLITGGVAASKRLNEMMNIMCDERGADYFVCPMEYSGDNGAMIAVTGELMKNAGVPVTTPEKADIYQKWRVDDIKVTWVNL